MGVNETVINIRCIIQILILKILRITKKKNFKYNISVTCVLRDEALYIREWIDYYKLLGVDHFYVYDNKSKDNIKEILRKDIDEQIVTYRYVNAENHPQGQCYTDAIFKYRNQTKYMMFVDIDEFLQIRKKGCQFQNIVDELFEKDKKISGIGFNWLCFGSSGLVHRPKGKVVLSYLNRSDFLYEPNKHIKTLCNPRRVFRGSPHTPYYYKNYYSINEEGTKIYGPFNEHCEYNLFSLNHYAAKSMEEQEMKRKKGFGNTNLVHVNHDINDIYDPSMLDFYEYLQKNKKG